MLSLDNTATSRYVVNIRTGIEPTERELIMFKPIPNNLSKDDFEVIRSDVDGGWSIHWLGDEASEDDLRPLLLSGPSEYDESTREFERPNAADYTKAIALLRRRIIKFYL